MKGDTKTKLHPYSKQVYDHYNRFRNAELAVPMENYMRNKFKFFGIKAPERRSYAADFFRTNALPASKDLQKVIKELWHMEERELQYFAIEMLSKSRKNWTADDIPFHEFLITNKSWWDTVDFLANHVCGPWFIKYPDNIPAVTERWNKSDNIWLQRMSLLYQLKYKSQTDTARLTRYILHLADSNEFFVQKAIGWVLREYSKTNPEWVNGFLKKHQLKPLSYREALKVINRK